MTQSSIHQFHSSLVRNLRGLLVAALACTLLVTSCAASADESSADPSAEPSSETTGEPVVMASVLPAVVEPMELSGTLDEQASQLADALNDESADRGPAALAAFSGVGLPVLLSDGTSLTTTSDPIGLPWSIVASLTSTTTPRSRLSLAEITSTLELVAPGDAFDSQTVETELVQGLRNALVDERQAGPTLLARLVAEEARRTNGVELADPAATADQLFVSLTTAMMLESAALRAMYEVLATQNAGSQASNSGLARRSVPPQPMATPLDSGCDDGLGGWGLWVGSKIAAGGELAAGVGLEWKGIFTEFAEYGISRGFLTHETLELTGFAGTVAGMLGVFINVILLQQQLAGRNATATMDGAGPLVRTKTTNHGATRTITLTISNEAEEDDPDDVAARNCILAALAVTGNNAQQVTGMAAHVQVDTHGGLGFTTNLDTHGTTVLFGPATFQPEQTSGDDGTIQIPVQGRAQPHDISDATHTVDKQFSLWFDAGLDPIEASQLGRAAADDALCVGTALGGGGFATFAECQNAIIDIVKQFHWHVGEYFFPLTDWQQSGWEANAFVTPYSISTVKCDGAGGTWSLDVQGNLSGALYNATVQAEVDDLSGKGTYSLSGQAVGGGVTVPVTGYGELRFVQDGPDAAHLEISGSQFGPRDAGGSIDGFIVIPLTPTNCTE